MGRLVSCVISSLVLHAAVWGWLAVRFSIFKHDVAQPAPEPIEVEAVTDLPAPGGGGGGATAAPKHARVAKVPSRPATTEIAAPAETAETPDTASAGPDPGATATRLRPSVAPHSGAGTNSGPGVGPGSGTGSGPGVGPGSGTGTGPGAGTGSGPGSGSGVGPGGIGSNADIAALIQARILAHRRYPLLARKRGLEGTVEVVFRVDARGNVVDLRVDKSAGELFDAAAVDAVRASAPLPVCAQPVRVPIRFRLVDERAIR